MIINIYYELPLTFLMIQLSLLILEKITVDTQ